MVKHLTIFLFFISLVIFIQHCRQETIPPTTVCEGCESTVNLEWDQELLVYVCDICEYDLQQEREEEKEENINHYYFNKEHGDD
jgi:hypothetical protein